MSLPSAWGFAFEFRDRPIQERTDIRQRRGYDELRETTNLSGNTFVVSLNSSYPFPQNVVTGRRPVGQDDAGCEIRRWPFAALAGECSRFLSHPWNAVPRSPLESGSRGA